MSTAQARRALDGAPVDATASLYAAYVKAGGDRRTTDALREEGAAKIERLRARGYDVGYGHDAGTRRRPSAHRLEAIYAQARHALYAVLDAGVVQDGVAAHMSRPDAVARPRGLPRASAIRRIDSRRRCASGSSRVVASSGSRRPQRADRDLGRPQRQRVEREPARGAAAAAPRARRRRPARRRRRRGDSERARARRLSRRRARRRGRRRPLDRRAARHRARHAVGVSHLRPRRRRAIAMEPRSRSRGDDRRVRHPPRRETAGRGGRRNRAAGPADPRNAAFGCGADESTTTTSAS